jgi:hypothetical protein
VNDLDMDDLLLEPDDRHLEFDGSELWTTGLIGEELTDEEGRTYQIDDVLAAGGQGAVYRTSTEETVVKVFATTSGDPLAGARQVRRLPLLGLSVTPPMSLIAEPPGYVLRFQDQMVPARTLRWDQRNHQKDFWRDTGGLARRLALCARIASIFEQLHERGLVYGDLNDRNVLISDDAGYDAVTLIDLDNLRYLGDPCSKVYVTPGFAAPELWRSGRSPDFSSDAFALAVLIFQILTLVHPFMDGEAVRRAPVGDPDYRAGQRCDLPSVLDDNGGNTCDSYPVGSVEQLLPAPLLELLRATFGEGRATPSARATTGALRMAAHGAYCDTITCEACEWSYATSIDRICPDCGAATPTRALSVYVPGAAVPLWSAAAGTRWKRVDLSLAFSGLAARRRTREDWEVDLRLAPDGIRARAAQPNQLPLPGVIRGGEPCTLPGFGTLELRVGATP